MIGDVNLFLKGESTDPEFEVEVEIMIAGESECRNQAFSASAGTIFGLWFSHRLPFYPTPQFLPRMISNSNTLLDQPDTLTDNVLALNLHIFACVVGGIYRACVSEKGARADCAAAHAVLRDISGTAICIGSNSCSVTRAKGETCRAYRGQERTQH